MERPGRSRSPGRSPASRSCRSAIAAPRRALRRRRRCRATREGPRHRRHGPARARARAARGAARSHGRRRSTSPSSTSATPPRSTAHRRELRPTSSSTPPRTPPSTRPSPSASARSRSTRRRRQPRAARAPSAARACSTSRPTTCSTARATRPYREDDPTRAARRLRREQGRGRAAVRDARRHRRAHVVAVRGERPELRAHDAAARARARRCCASSPISTAARRGPTISPTALLALAAQPDARAGVYHYCNDGATTWHGVRDRDRRRGAQASRPLACERIDAITTAEYPTPARRARRTRCSTPTQHPRARRSSPPSWRHGLARVVARRSCHERVGSSSPAAPASSASTSSASCSPPSPATEVIVLDKLTYAGNPRSLAELAGEPRLGSCAATSPIAPLVRELLAERAARARSSTSPPRATSTARSTAPRTSSRPTSSARSTCSRRRAAISRAPPIAALPLPPRLDRRGVRRARPDRRVRRDHAVRSAARRTPRRRPPAITSSRAYVHTYKFPAITTNCSNNYGPYQFPEKLIPLTIANALAGKRLPVYGKGENVRDWIYVTDHCARDPRGPREGPDRRVLPRRLAQRAARTSTSSTRSATCSTSCAARRWLARIAR